MKVENDVHIHLETVSSVDVDGPTEIKRDPSALNLKQTESFVHFLVTIRLDNTFMIHTVILNLQHVKPILNSQPNSVSATYLTSSHSENQLIYVKEEEDPLSITLPVVKAENEVSHVSLC
jgi:hypothetical protein